MTDQLFGLQECPSCRYAVAQNPLVKSGPLQCRRRPPIPVPIQTQGGMGSMNIWPLVARGDSCGDGLPRFATPAASGPAHRLPHLVSTGDA